MQDSKLHVAEVAEPVPGPGEVLFDVLAAAYYARQAREGGLK